MKILVLEKNTISPNDDISFEPIKLLGDVQIYDMLPDMPLETVVCDADAVICNKAKFTSSVIEKCPNLKYIGLWATGYDNVDIAAAKKNNLVVCNCPGYSTMSVAQHTFSMILNLASNMISYDKSVANGDWKNSPMFTYLTYPIIEIYNKNLGIIGYGSIGKAVAKIGVAFGMNPIIYTRTQPKDCPYEVTDLDTLLRKSDFVTLHCPLTEDTNKLINTEALSKMKKTAFLINTSRGGVIDENALAEALHNGSIAGAGIDVLSSEPMSQNHPYFNAPNCIITPHIAWASLEARKRLFDIVTNNLQAFLNNSPINNVANK